MKPGKKVSNRCRLLCCFLAFCAFSTAENIEAQTVEEWREDIQFLREQLPLRHHNPFHRVTSQQFESAISTLQNRLQEISREQIIVEFARLGAMIGDGHSGIRLAEDPAIQFRSFPLALYLFEDGLFVVTAAQEYSELAGARVLEIANQPWEKVWDAVADLVPADNSMGKKAFTPLLLMKAELLNALGFINDMERLDLVVENKGKRKAAQVRMLYNGRVPDSRLITARAVPDIPLGYRNRSDYYWFEFLPASKTLYVQLNKMMNKKEEGLDLFFDRVFEFVDRNELNRFVLDLRWNSGGFPVFSRSLVSRIIRSTKINQPGNFFVLIGRNTFSAAIRCLTELERYTTALFVGEPTGGSPNHFGAPFPIILPNSGLTFFASTQWRQNGDPDDRRLWISPDLAAPLTSGQQKEGVDPAIEAILKYKQEPHLEQALLRFTSSNRLEDARTLLIRFRENPYHRFVDTEAKVDWVGHMLLQGKHYEAALRMFEWNVHDFPESWRSFENLAEAQTITGMSSLAVENYRKALLLNPNTRVSLAGLAVLEHRNGNRRAALPQTNNNSE